MVVGARSPLGQLLQQRVGRVSEFQQTEIGLDVEKPFDERQQSRHQKTAQQHAQPVPRRAGQQSIQRRTVQVQDRLAGRRHMRGVRHAERLTSQNADADRCEKSDHAATQPHIQQLRTTADAIQHQNRPDHGRDHDHELKQPLSQRDRDHGRYGQG